MDFWFEESKIAIATLCCVCGFLERRLSSDEGVWVIVEMIEDFFKVSDTKTLLCACVRVRWKVKG